MSAGRRDQPFHPHAALSAAGDSRPRRDRRRRLWPASRSALLIRGLHASLARDLMRQGLRVRRRTETSQTAIIGVSILDFLAGFDALRSNRRSEKHRQSAGQPSCARHRLQRLSASSAKNAPCGSRHCAIHRSPGTCCGPLRICPPPSVTRAKAASSAGTVK